MRGHRWYPSSVLMNAIPARIAGVKEIIMVTPPSKNGKINNAVMLLPLLRSRQSLFMRWAQAVAALAFGTDSMDRVDKL